MTRTHLDALNKRRRLAQFKRAYFRATRGRVSWSKVLMLRAHFAGFLYGWLRDSYPVPSEWAK